MATKLIGKDFLTIEQLEPDELLGLIADAAWLKANRRPFDLLAGKSVALLFQKPSLRTRVSFEVAATELGAHCLYLSPAEVGLGEREDVADVARVLSRYVHAIVARTFFHKDIEALARAADIPVINGLSDQSHPCQILGDLLTIQERFGSIRGLTVTFVGDGNNVARSLIEAAPRAGFAFRIACPSGYEPDADAVERALNIDPESVVISQDPSSAVRGADVVYTDVWFSMGQEAEREQRASIFPPFRLTADLLQCASPQAIVMHCLPAHRGEEITDEVMESPQSAVFDQAENRLHAQKALLANLLAPQSAGGLWLAESTRATK
ncbi:MAG: ornithine carbamoyltransferase [Chloroflexi bacterium]|nr:ornithine carbamoyltransferase [Chloroflexota bacterium]